MAAINAGAVVIFILIRRNLHADLDPRNTLFLVLLISLLITLYDRYRTMQERRVDHAELMAHFTLPSAGPRNRPAVPASAERTP